MSMADIQNLFSQMIRPVKNRIMLAIARGVIETVDDSEGVQFAKSRFLAGEIREGVERFQNFGFTSNPPADSECIALFPGGNRENGFIISVESRGVRIKNLATGESCQYNSSGDKWHLKSNSDLEGLVGNDWNVTVGNKVNLTITGNLEATFAKLKLSNGTDELIDLLVQELDALIAEPFIVNKATFIALKAKLGAFKV